MTGSSNVSQTAFCWSFRYEHHLETIIGSALNCAVIPTLNYRRSFLPGRPMMKPRFRMDRAGECALSGRILFLGRFSHGVAMGWKRSAPCGASELAKIRAAFLNKAERFIHGVPIANNPENSDTWYQQLSGERPSNHRPDAREKGGRCEVALGGKAARGTCGKRRTLESGGSPVDGRHIEGACVERRCTVGRGAPAD